VQLTIDSKQLLHLPCASDRPQVWRHLELRNIRDSPVSSAGLVGSTAHDSEETVLAPVGAPTVAGNPEVGAVLGAPAVELDGVVGGAGVAGVVHVDAAGVGLNAVGVDVGGHGAAGEDLGHDVVVASHGAVLGDGDLRVLGDGVCRQHVQHQNQDWNENEERKEMRKVKKERS
jgi:hypothetical protein